MSVRELAQLIADVFFEGVDELPGVDDAMADALESLETHLEVLGEELGGSVFVLLRDVRNGVVERTSARVTAEVLLRHVAATAGVATVEPLVRFLGALAVLPDGAETHPRAFDPTPDPESAIEVAMAAQVIDPGARGQLRRALYAGSLIVPVLALGVEDTSLSLRFLPVFARGMPMVSAFTSQERIAEHAAAVGVDDVPTIEVDGFELSMLCPLGHGVAVNPGWVAGCVLEEIEVRSLPHAPGLVVPDGEIELRPARHPAIVGALDAVRDGVDSLGVAEIVAAHRDDDIVIAVVGHAGTTPEQAVRRVAAALAERGFEGPVVVPAASPIGRAVMAVCR